MTRKTEEVISIMNLQKLYSYTRKALSDYQMIEPGDRIAIGVSGGKDSLTLLYALSGLREFYPASFSLHAVTVDPGFSSPGETKNPTDSYEPVRQLCDKLQIPYTVIDTPIFEILKHHDTGKPYCSLCARLRRGTLKDALAELNCNKLAYAHHKDDVIETALLSTLYGGRFSCFLPVTVQDCFSVIRPLIYIPEGMIRSFSQKYELPVVPNPCPYDNHSRRSDMKEMLNRLHRINRIYKDNIFHAVTQTEDWIALYKR